MPLLKLWNALLGRSSGEQPVVEQPASSSPATVSEKPVTTRKTGSGFVSSGFGLFSSNPHAALCKQVVAAAPRSILEIGVGDGTRAVAVMEALAKQGIAARYFGMDQFELAGGGLSLRDFHRTMRGAGIRPQLFPEPVPRGLIRFLHTIGSVDLVLVADPAEVEQDAGIQQLLRENELLRERLRKIRTLSADLTANQRQPESEAFHPWLLPLIMLGLLLSFIGGIAFKNYRIARRAGLTGRDV